MKTPAAIDPLTPKSFACLAALALLVPVTHAQVTIFSHSFDEGTGGLNATAVDTGTGSWVTFGGVNADGVFNPLGTTSAGGGSATLAFSPSNGFTYQLDARINEVVGTGDWVGLGFANGQTTSAGPNHRFILAGSTSGPGPVGTAWMLFRGNNSPNANNTFLGSGIRSTTNQGLLNSEAWPSFNNGGGSIDLRIVLDTTGGSGNWTATWLAKNIADPTYTTLRAAVAVPVADESRYTSVGFAFSSGATDGILDTFSLTAFPEATPPQWVTLNPPDDSTGVWTGTNLMITFDEPVQAGSSGAIEIRRSSDSALVESFEVTSSPQLSFPGGSTVTIDPSTNLIAGVEYHVLIADTAITDLLGNEFEGISDPAVWSFTTDGTPPVGSGMGPMVGATEVSPLTDLLLNFDEPIQAGTGTLTIHLASDGSVVQTIDVTTGAVVVSGSGVTITPGQLAGSTSYYINLSSGAFTDLSGNAYAGINGNTTWTFTTAAIPEGVLFSHAFGGDSTDLNGTSPDVTTGSANWIASAEFNQDGTTGDGPGSATLAFTPFNGLVYTLEASYSGLSALPGDIDWFGMGFVNGQSDVSSAFSRFISTSVVGGPWMMVRGNVSLDTNLSFLGNGQLGGGDNGLGPGGVNNGVPWSLSPTENAVDLRIILDTTGGPGAWTATWYAKNSTAPSYSEVRPTQVLFDPTTITAVGLACSGPGVTATAESFRLYTGLPQEFNPPVLKITITGGALDFEWDSLDGMQYDLLSSTDLATPISTWPPYNDGVTVYENIAASGTGTNTLTGVVKLGPRRFFALAEEPLPLSPP
jgi:hypothetical protein